MQAHHPTKPFTHPLMLWGDVALKTGEMLVSSGSVIQARTQRMALAGLSPSAADRAEFALMGQEKLDAADEAGAAIAHEIGQIQAALVQRTVHNGVAFLGALFALAVSLTPAEALSRQNAFMAAASRSAADWGDLSNAGAQLAQRSLMPIHAKATSNARRLGAGSVRTSA